MLRCCFKESTAYRYHHSIAENLNKLLMHESHVTCPKEANRPRPLLLDGKQLLGKRNEKHKLIPNQAIISSLA